MKRITFALFILLGVSYLQAQIDMEKLEADFPPEKQKNTALRLGVLSPNLILEQKITERISLIGKLGMEININIQNIDTPNPSAQVSFFPHVGFEPRYYLGKYERELAGNRKDHFSGLYIGLPFRMRVFDPGYSVGPMFGFQTSVNRKVYFRTAAGLGYNTIEEFSYIIGVRCDLELGFILN